MYSLCNSESVNVLCEWVLLSFLFLSLWRGIKLLFCITRSDLCISLYYICINKICLNQIHGNAHQPLYIFCQPDKIIITTKLQCAICTDKNIYILQSLQIKHWACVLHHTRAYHWTHILHIFLDNNICWMMTNSVLHTGLCSTGRLVYCCI